MKRKLKSLGLIFGVVFAMGAMTASAAQAVTFHTGSQETSLLGEPIMPLRFTTVPAELKCRPSALTQDGIRGTKVGPGDFTTEALSLTPSCTGMTLEFTMNANGCTFELNHTASPTVGAMWLKCPAGKKLVVSIPAWGCTFEYGEQGSAEKPLGGTVNYVSSGSPKQTNVNISVQASYTNTTVKNLACGTPGEVHKGAIQGLFEMKGFNGPTHTGGQIDFWVA